MHRTLRCVLPLCGAAILLFASFQHGSTADPRDETILVELGPSDQAAPLAEARLRELVFSSRITASLKDVSLREAIRAIAGKAGIRNVTFDEPEIQDSGADLETPLSQDFADVALTKGLRSLLEPNDLGWYLADEMLVITSRSATDEKLIGLFYDIRELRPVFAAELRARIAAGVVERSGAVDEDARLLIELITSHTAGPWESIDGWGGSISQVGNSLRVVQTESVQHEISDLLKTLTEFLKGPARPTIRPLLLRGRDAELWIRQWEALSKPIGPLEFQETPFDDVLRKLTELSSVRVTIPASVRESGDIDPGMRLSLSAERLTLASALHRLFRLTPAFGDEGIVLAGPEEPEITLLYDVRDLRAAGISDEWLINWLQHETGGPWEPIDGSGGTIDTQFTGALIIRQTLRNHIELARMLTDLRARWNPGDPVPVAMRFPNGDPSELVIEFYNLGQRGLGAKMEKVIVLFVAPESWKANGGQGTICQVEDVVLVRQTRAVQRKIHRFLTEFKRSEETPFKVEAQPQPFGGGGGFF